LGNYLYVENDQAAPLAEMSVSLPASARVAQWAWQVVNDKAAVGAEAAALAWVMAAREIDRTAMLGSQGRPELDRPLAQCICDEADDETEQFSLDAAVRRRGWPKWRVDLEVAVMEKRGFLKRCAANGDDPVFQLIVHESWCQALKSGSNCNPDAAAREDHG
jgi:hypothetical protein